MLARGLDSVTHVSTELTDAAPSAGVSRPRPPQPGLLLVFSESTPLFRPLAVTPGVPVRLGRDDVGGARVPDRRMSREHLELRFEAGVFHLEDLGSTNGSALDGRDFTGRVQARGGAVLRTSRTLFLLLDDVHDFLLAEVRREQLGRDGREVVVGPSLRTALERAAQARQRDANLFIHGESGSGKELIAEHYHRAGSPRGPWCPLNSASLSSTLAEAQLFGTRRGTFTEARDSEGLVVAADGGVLFLDEIVELSAAAQAALLRVVQSGEVLTLGETKPRHVSVRFVTASHQDMRQRAADGRFREDLFFRLNQATVEVPPLRARREELPWLLQLEAEAGGVALHVSLVEEALLRPWPGNCRELRVELAAAVAEARRAQSSAVRATHLAPRAGRALQPAEPRASTRAPEAAAPAGPWTISREDLAAALASHGGNVSATARALDVHRNQLNRLRKRYGLASADEGADDE